MAKNPTRIGDRLAVLERHLKPQAPSLSKAQRDMAVRQWSADPANLAPELAALKPHDDRGRAAIDAAFRADG